MFRSILFGFTLAAIAIRTCPADTPIPRAPQVAARAYILVDFRSDKVLAANNPVARLEPASLTKLMTSYIVFEQLSTGKLKLDQVVTVSERAWRSEGSRSFIELGKPVPVETLVLGMIVQSGNDATIALAERIGGTEDTFVQLMNSTAARLGMTGTHFDNSSGLPSARHYTTARDMSLLAAALIRDFPQYYHWFSVHEFTYNGIKQQNRNGLLGTDVGVDGLKTGHTDSAGFCLVTSAERGGMRLISVVLGSTSMKAREQASTALLNYGYTFYETALAQKAGTVATTAPVWKAERSPVDIGIQHDLWVTVPRGSAASLKTTLELEPRLLAPLAKATIVGQLRVAAGGVNVASAPLHPLVDVAAGGWWRRLIDTVRLWLA